MKNSNIYEWKIIKKKNEQIQEKCEEEGQIIVKKKDKTYKISLLKTTIRNIKRLYVFKFI